MSETLLNQEQLQKLVGALANGASVAEVTGMGKDKLESLYALGHGLYSSGSYEDAVKVFQALALYDSGDYRFWLGLGGCRQALGQYEAAVDAYQMAAVATQLENPEPFLFAARCLIKLGKKEDAVVAVQTVLALAKPEDARWATCRAKASAILALLKKE